MSIVVGSFIEYVPTGYIKLPEFPEKQNPPLNIYPMVEKRQKEEDWLNIFEITLTREVFMLK